MKEVCNQPKMVLDNLSKVVLVSATPIYLPLGDSGELYKKNP